MKSSKILIAALVVSTVLFSGCEKEVFTGIDTSKAGVTDFTYDEENSSSTSVAFYWDAEKAKKAGATSFSVQLAKEADFRDIDMYDSSIGQTIQATATIYDAVTFSNLVENTRYFARVRANYERSIYSDWSVLSKDGAVICIAVGHGEVLMEFVTPQNFNATPLSYKTAVLNWGAMGPAEGFAAEYKKSSESTWTNLPETSGNSIKFDGDQNTSYDVRVRAFRTVDGNKEYTDYATSTVTIPARVDHNITNAAEFNDFLAAAPAATGCDVYVLKADIDLGGAELNDAISKYAGEVDGENHVVKNFTANTNLIADLANAIANVKFSNATFKSGLVDLAEADAVISGIEFDNSCKFSFPIPASGQNLGILCNTNKGTVTGCKSAAVTDLSYESNGGNNNIGGLVGMTTGLVKDCSFSGTLKVAFATGASYSTIGGVVGLFNGNAGTVIINNCSNSGTVSLEYNKGAYFCVGGVVGGSNSTAGTTLNCGIIDGVNNTGDVKIHYIAGGSGAYPNIGGCVGYLEGYLQNGENSGSVTLDCDSESDTWTNSRLAGVAGYCKLGAKDCKNHGQLSINALTAGGTAGNRNSGNTASTCIAGVIASAGPYNEGSEIAVFENLSNDANLTIKVKSLTGTPNSYYGGVLGNVTGDVKNCINTGSIAVTSPIAVNRVGGVTAGASGSITDCVNNGAVSLDQDISAASGSVGTWRNYLAGICAHYTGKGPVKSCTNEGSVTASSKAAVASSRTSGIAGIIGFDENGNGSEITDCSNTGALSQTGSNCQIGEIYNVGL